jgi:hypothetical protein
MLQVPFCTIMENKSDVNSYMVYCTETEDVVSEPNLTAKNQASVVVKLEMPDDSEISMINNRQSSIHFQDFTIKTEPFNHRNLAYDDDTTNADSKNSMKCFKHEYTYEDSTHVVAHTVEEGASVIVKSEMSDDSGMSTTPFSSNVPGSQESTVKTEVIVS